LTECKALQVRSQGSEKRVAAGDGFATDDDDLRIDDVQMVEPVWAGCISSSDDAWMRWLEEKGVTNFAWSSQARGFFTDRAGRGKMDDSELAPSWYSEDNVARRDRAIALGRKLGKDPIQIALAYVLAQKRRVILLIGPRSLSELNHSLDAFSVKLSPGDVQWLRDGDPGQSSAA
jgi:aryl-alcohol dehydrogenase-like predicted oxidoreductase